MSARRQGYGVGEESGAILILVGVGLATIIMVAALVLDLGALRATRSNARLATDAAAAAAALWVPIDHVIACETALAYAEGNLPGNIYFSGADCSGFPTFCDTPTPEATTTDSQGRWTITVTYPLSDSNPMMSSSAIGAVAQSIDVYDGHKCERIGVSLTTTQDFIFAGSMGVTSGETSMHTVGLGRFDPSGYQAANLVILERYDCDSLHSGGGGGQSGGIRVGAVLDPTTGVLAPGAITNDSNGSTDCSSQGTYDVNGVNAEVRSDGPAGCLQQTGTHGGQGGLLVGEGCGYIKALASGTPGCNFPACTSTGTILPDPTRLLGRVTRQAVDHLYNCKGLYTMPVGWEIHACEDPPDPHIDDLVAAYGIVDSTPTGFQTWTSLGYDCTITGNPGIDITVVGNTRIDCPDLVVARKLTFENASVIFDGDISVGANGDLSINSATGDPAAPGLVPGVVYFRDGLLSKSGGATLRIHNSVTYLSATSVVSISGGNGLFEWSGATGGDFKNLALWSDSASDLSLGGNASFSIKGVIFAPLARIVYIGGGSQIQIEAQFIARALRTQGNGVLVLEPRWETIVQFPTGIVSYIVR